MSNISFVQLVDIEQIQQLLEAQYKITGILSAILDTDENILVAVGWQEICTRFHRVHPSTSARCRESDARIKAHLQNLNEEYLDYRCRNGLRDVAMPIIIGGEHVATLFTGQFFYDDEKPDQEFFRAQAAEFGFDTESYLAALNRVPVCSREQIRNIMGYYHRLVQVMVEMGMKNLNLDTLEKRVEEELAKNRAKDIMLIQQNRQAALGEMLDHIAHQWKQPVNAISLIVQDLEETSSWGDLTDEYVKDAVGKILRLLEHMAQTIDVFRDFYKPEKEMTVFRIKDSIDMAVGFIAPALSLHAISVELDVDPGLAAVGHPKEYAQVLLNILGNARDALTERKIEKSWVKLRAYAEGGKAVVTITDNAGGISEINLDKIFEPYFTTRKISGGTGIGLYMSKNIIEKSMEGTLSAANVNGGAQFRIEIPAVSAPTPAARPQELVRK